MFYHSIDLQIRTIYNVDMFKTVDEIKAASKNNQNNWFEDFEIIYWSIRVCNRVWATSYGSYFITSEQLVSQLCGVGTRYYTVRFCHLNGEIEHKSKFMEFKTLDEASNSVRQSISN